MSTHPARKGISQSSCCWTRFRNCSCSRWFIRHRKRAICGRSRNKCPFLRDPFTSAKIFRWLRERSSGVRLAKTGKLSRSPESSSIRRVTRSRAMCLTSVPVKWPLQLFQWTPRVPPWTFGTNEKLSVLQHLPYALLNLQLARKNSDSVIPTEPAE
jgi:hypothetical protein